MDAIDFRLVLNLHQPAVNLDDNEWEAKEILWTLDRIPRSLWADEAPGALCTLLETLADLCFQQRVHGIVDCGSLLWRPQIARTIEVLGSVHHDPVLPLIPPSDREEQIMGRGRPRRVEHRRPSRQVVRRVDRLDRTTRRPRDGCAAERSGARCRMRDRRRRARRGVLGQARWRVLRAETSCNFSWARLRLGCSVATTTMTKPPPV